MDRNLCTFSPGAWNCSCQEKQWRRNWYNEDRLNHDKADMSISVYHDLGNLNVSFMTSKARHNRKENLGLLCDVVKDALRVNLEVNSRLSLIEKANIQMLIAQ